MADNDPLQAEEQVIEEAVASHAAEISLDQPYPAEVHMENMHSDGPAPVAPPAVAEDAPTQPKVEESPKAEEKPPVEAAPVTSPEGQTAEEDKKDEPKKDAAPEEEPQKVAGYTASEIAEAPVKPPESAVPPKEKKAARHPNTKLFILIGIILFVIGVALIIFVDPLFGGIAIFIAASIVIAAVFLPVHKLKLGLKHKK